MRRAAKGPDCWLCWEECCFGCSVTSELYGTGEEEEEEEEVEEEEE